MTHTVYIEGAAAPLPIANLDTDQIMPKQFLRRIDKAGLAAGLLYDLRFDAQGQPRPGCVLNQDAWSGASILVGGPNFGCGSSREHAVWGLQQFGIQAVIASSFGEIFYSNAMNNRLLLVMLPEDAIVRLMADAADPASNRIAIDLQTMTVRSRSVQATFTLSARHLHMFREGLDMIGASLLHRDAILAFAAQHWHSKPWLQGVAQRTRARLGNTERTLINMES
jgi:3-isopropylmalate/(R)-2-methylmalate dehydratase small subunit